MMINPDVYIVMVAAALAGLGMIVLAALAGWRGWLAFKREQLARSGDARTPAIPAASARIEIADLKERIRKLEAIAAGVDL